jgi:hypothetical protein
VGPQFAAGAAYTDLGGVSIQTVGNLNRIVKPKAYRRRSRTITILDAIADPQLFGQHFRDHVTWAAWCVFLCALFGLPLTSEQLAFYTRFRGGVHFCYLLKLPSFLRRISPSSAHAAPREAHPCELRDGG